MSFADLIKKGSLRQFATATSATAATHGQERGLSVATVATVAVAKAQRQAANDPAQALGLVAAGAVASLVTPLQAVSSAAVSTPVSIEPAAMDDPDRWCWPYSAAMTGREIDTMAERTALFNRRGLSALDAELLADKLVTRDREADDRRLCLECAHLSGRAGAGRCSQWQAAGLGAPVLPAGMAALLQRCGGFSPAV
ncbi:MAG: hypothetical protein JWR60_771 [Polaromonas sp.]|nr:hypothetical protein [Polaromonas sp.]